jgi:hypothetical protein
MENYLENGRWPLNNVSTLGQSLSLSQLLLSSTWEALYNRLTHVVIRATLITT